MEHIAWNDSYRIGIPHIDRQHQRLFNLVNLFFETLAMEKCAAMIEPVLGGLLTYARTHFREEEAEMQRLGYPALDEHRQKHAAMKRQVEKWIECINAGYQIDYVAVVLFLKEWLTNHVMQDDKAIGLYVQTTNKELLTL